LEKRLLELLEFNVYFKIKYAKYYFELKALSKLDKDRFLLEPLSKEAALRLEVNKIVNLKNFIYY
jgi:hypothetical protein